MFVYKNRSSQLHHFEAAYNFFQLQVRWICTGFYQALRWLRRSVRQKMFPLVECTLHAGAGVTQYCFACLRQAVPCNQYTHRDSSQYGEVQVEVDECGCTDVHDSVSTSFLGTSFQVIIAVESWEESTRHAAASSDFSKDDSEWCNVKCILLCHSVFWCFSSRIHSADAFGLSKATCHWDSRHCCGSVPGGCKARESVREGPDPEKLRTKHRG